MENAQQAPGTLFVVGLGPGAPGLLAPDAAEAIGRAEVVVGYQGYLDQIEDRLAGKTLLGRPLGEEVERAQLALESAGRGHTVALVSSGDAGVYGMGGVVHELAAQNGHAVEIVVVPGITAACSAAAKLGAPLAHDWACISLSDLLTPWETIIQRVDAAARGDFVLVFYNPSSRARATQLRSAAERIMASRAASTPVGLVQNAFRDGERVEIVSLLDLALGLADVNMFTTVIVGSSQTFVADGRMITPRIHAAKSVSSRDPAAAPSSSRAGDQIMAESLSLIDHEMGPYPSDPRERAIVRRVIHASADFEYAATLRFGPSAISAAIAALRSGTLVVCDVEMLRAGVRRDLAEPLRVMALSYLNDPAAPELAAREGITRSAAAMKLAASRGENAIIAVGNAPTALEEVLRSVREGRSRPSCIIGLPVGFVGVEAAKRRLIDEGTRFGIPWIANTGRKGGTAVTAAVVNALLALAALESPVAV